MSRPSNRHRPRATTSPRRPPGAKSKRPASRASRQPGPAASHRAASRRTAAIWSAALLVLAGLITAAMLATSSGTGTAQSSTVRRAPAFTLPSTSGKTVSLASYRGRNIVLYFSEGAGCDACFYQMREFEQHAAKLTRAGLTIVPIVMNPAAQIRPDLAAFGIRTPYLTDTTGRVSRAYHVLGKGMHAGLPGHGHDGVHVAGPESGQPLEDRVDQPDDPEPDPQRVLRPGRDWVPGRPSLWRLYP